MLNTYFGRVDYQISDRQSLFVRFFTQNSTYFCDGCGGTNAAFSAGNTSVPSWTYALGHTWVVSPHILNQFTAMVAQSWNNNAMTQYTPDQYLAQGGSSIYKFPSLTWGYQLGASQHNFYQEVRGSLSISSGAHNIKLGFGFLHVPTNNLPGNNFLGTWTFGNDQYFNPADPSTFQNLKNPIQYTASYPLAIHETSWTYSGYAQDEWRIRRNLTLNLGVRYDLQTDVWNEGLSQSMYPQPLPYVNFSSRGDHNNIQPRVGLAWDLLGDGKTVVRAGYGIVDANIQNGWLEAEITTLRTVVINIKNPSYPDPFQGKSPLAFVAAAPNISINANNLVNPIVQSASVGVSRQLWRDMVLQMDALATRADHTPVNVQINTPNPETGVKPLTTWGTITQSQPIGTYNYHALLVRLDKRFANRFQYMVAYTLSSQTDNWAGGNTSAGLGSITNFYNQPSDVGPAPADRRNNFVVSGSANLRWGITVGAIWTLRSTLPFSALAGKDLNGDGANTDYVPGTSNDQGNRDLNLGLVNAWRAQNGLGPISASQIQSTRLNQFDIRVSKTFSLRESVRLQVIGQVFDLFGTNNLGGWEPVR